LNRFIALFLSKISLFIQLWAIADNQINLTTCNFTQSSSLYFPDRDILNHRILVAASVNKGSKKQKAIISDGFFFYCKQ